MARAFDKLPVVVGLDEDRDRLAELVDVITEFVNLNWPHPLTGCRAGLLSRAASTVRAKEPVNRLRRRNLHRFDDVAVAVQRDLSRSVAMSFRHHFRMHAREERDGR